MTDTLIEERYFSWLAEKVGGFREHKKLFRTLFNTPYVYTIPMDGNRYEDGIDLRYRFGKEKDIPDSVIKKDLDYTDCTLLEVMVAMAIRCEEHIMENDELGDRTPLWFWHMVESLGVMGCTDAVYDESVVLAAIDRLYNRAYSPDGDGGLVKMHKRMDFDMRRMELWDQMMAYLNEVLAEEQ